MSLRQLQLQRNLFVKLFFTTSTLGGSVKYRAFTGGVLLIIRGLAALLVHGCLTPHPTKGEFVLYGNVDVRQVDITPLAQL